MMPYRHTFTMPMLDDRFFEEMKPMHTDVRETENAYVLEAEIPGVAKEDISLEVKNDVLTISAGANEEKQQERDGYLVRERRMGRMERRFNVETVNQSAITADYKNGILTVNLPKKTEQEPDLLKIAIGDGE